MPKLKGESLGIVIVESGWGSMVPTVVLANMCPSGPAARCGQLNIGDQIISINGISLVGLPLSSCQTYIKVTNEIFPKFSLSQYMNFLWGIDFHGVLIPTNYSPHKLLYSIN